MKNLHGKGIEEFAEQWGDWPGAGLAKEMDEHCHSVRCPTKEEGQHQNQCHF